MLPLILNLFLGAFKFLCGTTSGMAAITADAANNLTDAVTSLLTMLGMKAASTLGGKRHENGHGRIEWIVGMIVSCSIMLVGWETLRTSVEAIGAPVESRFEWFILFILLLSVGAKLFLFFFYTNKSKKVNSSAYKAAAADCISDAVSTFVVTISFLLNSLLSLHVDGWCGILVSLFIMRNGMLSFAEISRRILGEMADDSLAEELRSYVLAYDKNMIAELVDFQLLDYGYERYGAFFTVRMTRDADRIKFLLLIADLKSDIYKRFGYVATIQAECPVTLAKEAEINRAVHRIVKEVDERLMIDNETRINAGLSKPQIVLHIKIPFKYSRQEREILHRLQEKLEKEPFSFTIKLMADTQYR